MDETTKKVLELTKETKKDVENLVTDGFMTKKESAKVLRICNKVLNAKPEDTLNIAIENLGILGVGYDALYRMDILDLEELAKDLGI